jgi:hypothetical protein
MIARKVHPGSHKKIALIAVYFGPWPEWTPLFFESCRWNPTIDWLIYADHEPDCRPPPNVRLTITELGPYKQRVGDTLHIAISAIDPYKFCDLKPMVGTIHADELAGYHYFGWCDLDVIFGDIRSIYDSAVLSHLVISSHEERIAGHFTLIENSDEGRHLFERVPNWRNLAGAAQYCGLDEVAFSRLFLGPWPGHRWKSRIARNIRPLWWRSMFKEQYSTPYFNRPWTDGTWQHPDEWYWREGKLTNNRDGDRQFLYLHFMNLRSSRYRVPRYGLKAPWETLPKVNHVGQSTNLTGFKIGAYGFAPLN